MDRLAAKDVSATIYVVGGAAAGLAYYPDDLERRMSTDVDAVFTGGPAVLAEAEDMAEEQGLRRNWFNTDAGRFIPPSGEPPGDRLMAKGHVEVVVPPARFLLAMKLRASRLGRDDEDIALLVRRVGISSYEEAEQLVADVYDGEEEIPPRGRPLLEKVLGEYELTRSVPPRTLPPVARS